MNNSYYREVYDYCQESFTPFLSRKHDWSEVQIIRSYFETEIAAPLIRAPIEELQHGNHDFN